MGVADVGKEKSRKLQAGRIAAGQSCVHCLSRLSFQFLLLCGGLASTLLFPFLIPNP